MNNEETKNEEVLDKEVEDLKNSETNATDEVEVSNEESETIESKDENKKKIRSKLKK